MSDTQNTHKDESDNPVVEIIRKIRDGKLSPKTVSKNDRKHCVQHLGAEGYSVSDIAQIFECSDRTIARDRKELLEENALTFDPEFTSQIAGYLVTEANNARARLMRITRDKNTSASDKIDGELALMEILFKMIDRLQRLGILPQAATHITADVQHSNADPPTFSELFDQLDALIEIKRQEGNPVDHLLALRAEATREHIAAQIVHETIDPAPRDPEVEADNV